MIRIHYQTKEGEATSEAFGIDDAKRAIDGLGLSVTGWDADDYDELIELERRMGR